MDKFWAIVLLGFLSITCNAQASLSCKVDRDTIEVGESIWVSLTASSLPKDDTIHNIQWSLNGMKNELFSQDTALMEEYADVQISDAGKFLPFFKDGLFLFPVDNMVFENKQWSARFKLSFFSPGKFVLTAPSINGATEHRNIHYQSSTLIVTLPKGMERDSLLEISENKDVIEIPRSKWDYVWMVLGALAITLILFLIYKYLSRPKHGRPPVEKKEKPKVVPCDLEALERLNQLNQKNLWQSGMVKEYQTELTFIVRDYIGKRYNFDALEMTSAEIISHSAIKQWQTDLHQKLYRLLTISDIVKFAKGSPSEDMFASFMENAIELVNQTKSENPK